MRPFRYTITSALFFILSMLYFPSFGQLGISFDIKKPKEFEDRVLRSERSDQKKFTIPRRFIQNTVTHYNYYFNANNKLNEVLERAKASFTDDFTKLLPFYNYSLDATRGDSIQLDSITYKASTGIALHDLRNDWDDNLYLLWGAAYYLQKEFDSAYLMFQFINYAFAVKEKDGYYRTIGSSRDGNAAYSIATKEKTSLPRKLFSEPPSRNDAFIWQIRNFLAQDQFAEAASLIVTLRNDPLFPKRLQPDLHEVLSLWFYKNHMWDSAAVHLVKAFDNATNAQEKARWEYLAAQLFELSGNSKEAEKYYTKVISHTTDLVMDVYARLYSIRVNKDGGEKAIDRNIAELIRMAKRDKYQDYRDIIYYMAAQMELERNNVDAAMALLAKSSLYGGNNIQQKNKAFLQQAELAYAHHHYRQAYNFYDSLRLDDPTVPDVKGLTKRKEMLGRLASNIEIIERQDSLQKIAGMPEDQRKDFVKKLARDLRKMQGLKDESTSNPSLPPIQMAPPLFSNLDSKGDWYFYNQAFRTRGASDFKVKWGNRPNVDNWRRSSAISGSIRNQNNQNQGSNIKNATQTQSTNSDGELTFDALYGRLPLTPDLMAKSNDSIQQAMFSLGIAYIQEIEDCNEGTTTLEMLRSRFPQFAKMDEVLFNLYYCYNKNGESSKAAAIKKLMADKYPNSNFTTIVTTGKNPASGTVQPEATKAYEKIYDLFIEGKFEQAVNEKKLADAQYGKNYWTPQLLYIEAVYYIKKREDSTATRVLNNIISQFPGSPLAKKSATLLDVLSRRTQIERDLTNLNVTRNEDKPVVKQAPLIVNNLPPKDTSTNKNPIVNVVKPKADTVAKAPPKVVTPFTWAVDASTYVVLILNKVDPVFATEAKNAFFRYNRETYYNKIMTVEIEPVDGENRILLISPFKNLQEAVDYINQTKPKTASEIIPWLKGGKYTFSVITDKNLDLLRANKDIANYQAFLEGHIKF